MRPNGRKFTTLELTGVTGDGTISGYASIFGKIDIDQNRIGERGAKRMARADKARPDAEFNSS